MSGMNIFKWVSSHPETSVSLQAYNQAPFIKVRMTKMIDGQRLWVQRIVPLEIVELPDADDILNRLYALLLSKAEDDGATTGRR